MCPGLIDRNGAIHCIWGPVSWLPHVGTALQPRLPREVNLIERTPVFGRRRPDPNGYDSQGVTQRLRHDSQRGMKP